MIPLQVTVIGSGESGIAAARYCAANGAFVLLSDSAPEEVVSARVEAADLSEDIGYEGGGHSDDAYDTDLMIVSPGVPATAELFKICKEKNIPVIGEVELGFRESVAKFVAVTGSAGKSTTVSLIDAVLKSAGIKTALCGNIGTPVVRVAPKLPADGVAVVEVSSFQLETIDTFKPEIAAILNLAPNHLDRHADLEEYYGAKFEIVRNMKKGVVILNGEQQELVDFGKKIKGNRVIFFGVAVEKFESVILENDTVIFIDKKGTREEYGSLENLRLTGNHNKMNAIVAAVAAKENGLTAEQFTAGIGEFGGMVHRMEFVETIDGVDYFNDSKATTPESMAVGLKSFESKKVILIAGGKDKGGDFESIAELVYDKCKAVVLIGTATDHLESLWKDGVTVVKAKTLKAAAQMAKDQAVSGDTVLLSPGCASFDMFKSFEERGNKFKAIVKGLVNAK